MSPTSSELRGNVDISDFTDADLSRLALSTQLQKLSESFRLAVAAEDEEGGELTEHLWSVLRTDTPLLQQAIVSYARSRGSSWRDIADLSGLSEDEARDRWEGKEGTHVPDPAAQTAVLDAWYVRHGQLEALSRVRDPFSRLLSERTPHERECLVCAKYSGRPVPAWAGFPIPPGGHLVDDGMWRVGHGPTPYWPTGTLLIESYRHFLDYADFSPEEATTLGPLVKRFTGPIKEATGATRVHLFSCMEGTEHFHLWMVPRVGDAPSGRTFIAEPGYCTPGEAEDAIAKIRQALERMEPQR
jgi:diadenosine tetraphosphate (Ap4A) HIT family hydrolase